MVRTYLLPLLPLSFTLTTFTAVSAQTGQSAAALQSPAASEPVLPRVVIDETNVDLSGAGGLNFDGDGDAIVALLPQQRIADLHGRLIFDHSGTPLGCQPEDEGVLAKASKALCDQLMRRSHFNLKPGFDLPFRQGQLAFESYFSQVEQPELPVRFLPPGSGQDYIIMPTANKNGKETCLLDAPQMRPADEEAVCNAWLSAGKPALMGSQARIWIKLAQGPGTSKPGYRVTAFERMTWKNREIIYSAPRPSPEAYLTVNEGQMTFPISSNDYPSRAMREGVQGRVTLLIGFERRGIAATCRPVASSGTAYLDNSTCWIVLRRARFNFAPTALQYSGVRYRETTVRWVLP